MITLLSTWTFGIALALVALGVYVSYKLFSFPDITTDGSFTLGAVVAAVLLTKGVDPFVATAAGMGAGAAAGSVTAILHAFLGVERLLSGILVSTALASVSLVSLGRSNVPLSGTTTLFDKAEAACGPAFIRLGMEEAVAGEAARLALVVVFAAGAIMALYLFFLTQLGTAMRAGGDTPSMARALGRNTGLMTVAGLALANSLTAASGALVAQYQGFTDVQMGIGMVVWGMASVFLGAALVGPVRLGAALIAAAAGSVTFRLLVASALRAGLDPDWLKAATAVVVLAALVAPRFLARRQAT
ncbi:MAG: ABC transporter permease [Planctomycetia bacterium]|nr:ABC transporter permease [Planctomycetia bacterium]